MPPVQVKGEVLSIRQVGAYHALTVVAPGIAESFHPGQFVAIAVGGEQSSMLLRRCFSVYAAKPRGVYGGTVEVVFAVHGHGTAWLAKQRPHDPLDVVGPLGRPFALPREPAICTLVGGGYGTAPLFSLAEALRARGCRVDFVLGAATDERLFGYLDAKRMSASIAVTTEDGSMGERGRVSDVLPDVIRRSGAEVVYACGPMGMLRAVSAIAREHEIPSQCAVEESMACGVGVCMTCVLPVVGDDGVTRMARACIEGPVFRGEQVRWDDVGTVPPDALGAATPQPASQPARSPA
jgi:dihydroorotate dehydrogenase electron transfer subunit